MSKYVDYSYQKLYTLYREQMFSLFIKGGKPMTANEIELMKLIFENDNPEDALRIVADVISSLSKQCESSQEPFAV